jgi:cytochrome c553
MPRTPAIFCILQLIPKLGLDLNQHSLIEALTQPMQDATASSFECLLCISIQPARCMQSGLKPASRRPVAGVGLTPDSGYNRGLFSASENEPETPMRYRTIPAALLCLAGLLLPTGSALAAGDVEAGKVKAYTCTGCHGIPGYKNVYPTYRVPKIGGQNYEYLVASLKAYQAGERDHPTMELQADALSQQDIEDIAAYFASLGGE